VTSRPLSAPLRGRPAALDSRDQAWFWTPQWQEREAEADADLAAGRAVHYTNDADFFAALDERRGLMPGTC
jgi:hypothetical protein